mmetsp:Transcript_27329/g.69007  ORF Transcript_27329/g.69007 Transcript_27329/m.69007 type:complete len:202 (-) Transcript_27329:665-1270(-)
MASSSSPPTRESAQTPGSTAAAPWSAAAAISAAGAWPMRSPRFQKKASSDWDAPAGPGGLNAGAFSLIACWCCARVAARAACGGACEDAVPPAAMGGGWFKNLTSAHGGCTWCPVPSAHPPTTRSRAALPGSAAESSSSTMQFCRREHLEPQKSESSTIAFAARATPSGSDTGTPMSSTKDGFGPAAERVSSKQSRVAPSR